MIPREIRSRTYLQLAYGALVDCQFQPCLCTDFIAQRKNNQNLGDGFTPETTFNFEFELEGKKITRIHKPTTPRYI